MRHFLLIAIICLAGCAASQPRPISLACGMPKAQLIERATAVFVQNGYQITFASADAGTVQAQRQETALDQRTYIWSVSIRTDSMVVNAQMNQVNVVLSPGVTTTTYWDDANVSGQIHDWYDPVMRGLRSVCAK